MQDRIELKLVDILNDDLNNFGKFDLIVSNPPYVSEKDFETLEPELKNHEPRISLTDSKDGITFFNKIISSSKILLNEWRQIIF